MADLRSVKRRTSFMSPNGGAPAKLFQTSTSRLAVQSLVASVSSSWEVKEAPCSIASGASVSADKQLSASMMKNLVMVMLLGVVCGHCQKPSVRLGSGEGAASAIAGDPPPRLRPSRPAG